MHRPIGSTLVCNRTVAELSGGLRSAPLDGAKLCYASSEMASSLHQFGRALDKVPRPGRATWARYEHYCRGCYRRT